MILLISSIGSGVSYALLLIRGSITSLVVSRVLIGLIKQSTTSCKALAMMSKDDHSPQRFSLIAALRHMGSFTGSLLLSLITSHFPLEYAILLCVVLYVIESIVIIWFIDPDDDSFSVDSSTSELNSNSNSNSNTKSSSSRYGLHLTPLLLLYYVYLFLIDVLNKGFGSIKACIESCSNHQIILLQDQFDGSPSQIGFLYVLSNLYMFLTEFFITPFLSRRFSSLRLVRFSILLLLIGKLAQLLLSSLYSFLPSFYPHLVRNISFFACLSTPSARRFSPRPSFISSRPSLHRVLSTLRSLITTSSNRSADSWDPFCLDASLRSWVRRDAFCC
ncbi:uncharacterized protein [Blastocystis hominis]|uniref:Major facilitator superfamily associated domain-containing protein n=1 Tax=Blastocystis hominis TaxID=12968 RepID=D8M3E1_BLAHO|nr:uncharacterized protein [Blastocystis hominis]CBK22414.2 unnamed protein product [Blastocystis hominis]|eukprot:XP_012896462.1 uncharacterized protein [Blastocystis hominis]